MEFARSSMKMPEKDGITMGSVVQMCTVINGTQNSRAKNTFMLSFLKDISSFGEPLMSLLWIFDELCPGCVKSLTCMLHFLCSQYGSPSRYSLNFLSRGARLSEFIQTNALVVSLSRVFAHSTFNNVSVGWRP